MWRWSETTVLPQWITTWMLGQTTNKAHADKINMQLPIAKSMYSMYINPVYVLLHHKVLSCYKTMNSCSISNSFLYLESFYNITNSTVAHTQHEQPTGTAPNHVWYTVTGCIAYAGIYTYVEWSCSVMVCKMCIFIHTILFGKQQFRLNYLSEQISLAIVALQETAFFLISGMNISNQFV